MSRKSKRKSKSKSKSRSKTDYVHLLSSLEKRYALYLKRLANGDADYMEEDYHRLKAKYLDKIKNGFGTRRSKRRRSKRRRSRSRSFGSPILLGLSGLAALGAGAGTASYLNRKKGRFIDDTYEEDLLIPLIPSVVSVFPKSFSDANPSSFLLRGPNYKTDHIKIRYPWSLYTTLDVKILKSEHMITDVISKHPNLLPAIPAIPNIPGELPKLLIINLQLFPSRGVFYSVVIFFARKENPLNNEISVATNLFKRYITDYNSEDFLGDKGRLKGIGSIDDSVFPMIIRPLIRKKNDTPNVLQKSLEHYTTRDIFEIDVNANKFNIPDWVKPSIPGYYHLVRNVESRLGFVIQGNTPEELPEILLGGTVFNGLDFSKAIEV